MIQWTGHEDYLLVTFHVYHQLDQSVSQYRRLQQVGKEETDHGRHDRTLSEIIYKRNSFRNVHERTLKFLKTRTNRSK